MKKNDKPIPVRSVVVMPRWMMVSGVVLCSVLALGCVGLMVWGALMHDETGGRWGAIVGGFGGLIGCAGGLYGTLTDWRRRYPATLLFAQLRNDKPATFYRVFWPAVAAFLLGVVLLFCCERYVWQPFLQIGGMLAFVSGVMEAMRRHTLKKARALFALYADGALAADDAAAIDDARTKDAKFDAEVRAFQQISEQVRRVASGE
jgi:hypothetical protein